MPDAILDELWRRHLEAIALLHEAGKPGAVHFQFAPWVTSGPDGLAHVAHCTDRLPPGYPMAVEFRNRSWFNDTHIASTLAFERERGLVHVVVDEPRGGANTIPAVWNATNDKLAPALEYRRRDCAAVHTLKLPRALSAL